MKIALTDQQINGQKEMKKFVEDNIIPNASRYDKEECLDRELIMKLAQKGYLTPTIAESEGGKGMDMVTFGLVNEELGRGCSSVRSLLTVHGMVAVAISRWGNPEQKAYWLPKLSTGEVIGAFALTEPNIGSDAKSIESTAEKCGDNYLLNGKKKWTTFGQLADIFLVIAQCQGKPTAFLVKRDTPGFNIKPIKGMLGIRGSMIAEINMENCRVPEANILGAVGIGLSHVAMSCLDFGRYTIAWGCVGMGRACLEQSINYSRKRKQFGVPLRQHQLIQKMITEMVVDIKAARLLCYNAGWLKAQGDPDSIMETWSAKYFASKAANKAASDAVQIHGANGCNSDYPVERFYRDARIMEIIEGTSQMHEVLISTNAFRGG